VGTVLSNAGILTLSLSSAAPRHTNKCHMKESYLYFVGSYFFSSSTVYGTMKAKGHLHLHEWTSGSE
jgi:hypothetical protein